MCDNHTSHKSVTPVTRWSHMSQSQVTQSYDTKKYIEDSKINNIIWYNNSMLVL